MIVWDLGGVVARFRPERRLAALADMSGLSPTHIQERIWGSGLDAAAESGQLDEVTVWAEVIGALDHRVSREELRTAWSLAFDPDAEVLAAIDGMGGDHALLTNNGPILDTCLAVELQALRGRFQRCILSCHLGCTKPDPGAFHRAAAILEVPADDLVLIDDQPANVASAREAGWRSFVYGDGDTGSAAALLSLVDRMA
jgi:glucose-1-phosphatase